MVDSLTYTDFFPDIHFDDDFADYFIRKIKDGRKKIIIKKQVKKIICDPTCGKPLKHNRKGTKEVYISPHRLYYHFSEKEEKIYFLEISHKNQQ